MSDRRLLLHSVTAVDAGGTREDAWLSCVDGVIAATGVGDGWRAHLAPSTRMAGGGGVAGDDGTARGDHPAAGFSMGGVGGRAGHDGGPTVLDGSGLTVTPGFIDLHQHGGGGHGNEDGPAGILAALDAHALHGTTRALASLVAAPVPVLRERLESASALAARTPGLWGVHLEGPFLAPARKGAHDESALVAPRRADVAALLPRGAEPAMITIAPELPGAGAAIAAFASAGSVVAIGHTECDDAQARAAIAAGARHLTHTFNAMPGIGHREPGPILAAVESGGITLEVIVDGHHVHPAAVRLLYAVAPGRVAAVTDAMAAAGAPDGRYRLGDLDVTVADGVATLAGTTTLAGSTLTMDAALRTGLAMGVPVAEMVGSLTATPARVLGRDASFGMLGPGFVADLVLVDAGWQVVGVYRDGVPVVSPLTT